MILKGCAAAASVAGVGGCQRVSAGVAGVAGVEVEVGALAAAPDSTCH